MPRSQKPLVIERIYDKLIDKTTGKLKRTVVTSRDVVAAILWCRKNHNIRLSEKNPANFMKDIIRGKGASGMWPDRLKKLKIGGRQVTGYGNVFEFVPYAEGQLVPFPTRFEHHEGVTVHRLQSVSMPLATKALGRDDETYLIQVAVKLSLVETHFALHSELEVTELTHLQIGIKLRLCEVDAMFAANCNIAGRNHRLIITAEAKKRGQRILEDQVIRQVRAAFNEVPTAEIVSPIAMTPAADGIYVVEFRAVSRDDLDKFDELELASEVLYQLAPPVKGINC